jgi:hypothetical protein
MARGFLIAQESLIPVHYMSTFFTVLISVKDCEAHTTESLQQYDIEMS